MSASKNDTTPTKSAAKAEKEAPVDKSDPIDFAMHSRKAAGSYETVIKADEAKKAKIQLPQSLNLKVEKPNEAVLTLITPEIIAQEEERTKEKAAKKAVSSKGKSNAPPADFKTDPIDCITAQRMSAGDINSHKLSQEAAADAQMSVPPLDLKLEDEKETF